MDEATPMLATESSPSALFDKYQYLLEKTYAEYMYDYMFNRHKYHLEKALAQLLGTIQETEDALRTLQNNEELGLELRKRRDSLYQLLGVWTSAHKQLCA